VRNLSQRQGRGPFSPSHQRAQRRQADDRGVMLQCSHNELLGRYIFDLAERGDNLGREEGLRCGEEKFSERRDGCRVA
jgi:hypothetical protein